MWEATLSLAQAHSRFGTGCSQTSLACAAAPAVAAARMFQARWDSKKALAPPEVHTAVSDELAKMSGLEPVRARACGCGVCVSSRSVDGWCGIALGRWDASVRLSVHTAISNELAKMSGLEPCACPCVWAWGVSDEPECGWVKGVSLCGDGSVRARACLAAGRAPERESA